MPNRWPIDAKLRMRHRGAVNSFKQHPGVSSTHVDGESILVDQHGAKMITLNRLGGLLWDQLETPRTLTDITEFCESTYPDVERAVILRDAEGFISQISDLGLVVQSDTES